MPVSVRLDPKTESLVNRLAKRKGRTKSDVIREGLIVLARTEVEMQRRTSPYDAIAHLLGCARGGPKDLSERSGEKVRKSLLARVRG